MTERQFFICLAELDMTALSTSSLCSSKLCSLRTYFEVFLNFQQSLPILISQHR
jgi:hypothetical protein